MNKTLKQVVAFSLSASIFVSPMFFAPVAYADAEFKEVTATETTAPGTQQPKTFKERLEAGKAAEAAVTNIPKDEAYIPGGTVLNLELTEALSSKTNHLGDTVKLKMLDNLLINDVVVIVDHETK